MQVSVFVKCKAYLRLARISPCLKELVSIHVQGMVGDRRSVVEWNAGNLVAHAVGGIAKGHLVVVVILNGRRYIVMGRPPFWALDNVFLTLECGM